MNERKFKSIKLFDEVAHTRYSLALYDKERRTTLLPKPAEFEENPDWISVTDPEIFKGIWPAYAHSKATRLDEFACYAHKTNAYYNRGRYLEYKDDLIDLVGLDKVKAELSDYGMYLEDMTFYELSQFCFKVWKMDITLDDEKGIVTKQESNILSHGTKWEEYTKLELKAICRWKDLTVSGTVRQLIAKLNDNMALFVDAPKGKQVSKKPKEEYSFDK